MNELVGQKQHYHFVTKILIDLFNEGKLPNVTSILIEPKYGYVGRLEYADGHSHVFRGANLGVNSVGAAEISKDKAYSKFFLKELGYKTPAWEVFLMEAFLEKIEKKHARKGSTLLQNGVQDASKCIENSFGYPCYAKYNSGSQGEGIFRCENSNDLEGAIESFRNQGLNLFLVEAAVDMPDFRVVVFGEDVISCYKRIPLQVTGDGKNTIDYLLKEKQRSFFESGREEIIDFEDKRMLTKLKRNGLSLEHVLARGKNFKLLDVSNLSAGGESEEFTHRIVERWKNLAVDVTANMGLRLCGVDLACEDLESNESDYSILEINASPGLDNYASSGEEQFNRVKGMYMKIFNELS